MNDILTGAMNPWSRPPSAAYFVRWNYLTSVRAPPGPDSGAGSLREAIALANNEAAYPGLDHIWFDSSMGDQTVQLTTADSNAGFGPSAFVITSDIIITGLIG